MDSHHRASSKETQTTEMRDVNSVEAEKAPAPAIARGMNREVEVEEEEKVGGVKEDPGRFSPTQDVTAGVVSSVIACGLDAMMATPDTEAVVDISDEEDDDGMD